MGEKKIKEYFRLKKLNLFTYNAVKMIVVLTALFAGVCTIYLIADFDVAERIIISAGFFITALLLFMLKIVPVLLERLDYQKEAVNIERQIPTLGNSLINYLQLKLLAKNNSLAAAAVVEAENRFSKEQFTNIISWNRLRKYSLHLLVIALFILSMLYFYPDYVQYGASRILFPTQEIVKPQAMIYSIEPGDLTIEKGSDINIKVVTNNSYKPSLMLKYREEQSHSKELELKAYYSNGDTAKFEYQFKSVESSFEYTAFAEGETSKTYKVKVLDMPIITSLKIRYDYPAYTGLPSEEVENTNGDISALKGTAISLSITSNNYLKSAKLYYSNSEKKTKEYTFDEIQAEVENSYTALFKIMENGYYQIELTDELDRKVLSKNKYKIDVIEDNFPFIKIVYPGKDVDVNQEMKQEIGYTANDDFGLSKVYIHYSLSTENTWQKLSIKDNLGKIQSIAESYLWNLGNMMLLPEDVVMYYLEVYDNDTVSGPKSSKSETFSIRFPSLFEIFQQTDEMQQQSISDLEKLTAQAKKLEENVNQVKREVQKDSKLEWQRQQNIQKMLEEQRKLEKQIAKINEKYREMADKLKENDAISDEVAERMDQINELVKDLMENSDELEQYRKKVEESMQNQDLSNLEKALENLEFNFEEQLKKMDRTIDLLKRVQIEQKMDSIAKKLEELAEKEKKLAEKAKDAKGDELEKLKEDQAKIQEDFEKLQEDYESLNEMIAESSPEFSQEAEEKAQEYKESQASDQMNDSQNQLSKNQNSKASESMQDASNSMQALSNSMMDMMNNFNSDMLQEVIKTLDAAIHEAIYISRYQEDLTGQLKSFNRKDIGVIHKFQNIQLNNFDNITLLSSKLYEISKKTFFITPAIATKFREIYNEMRAQFDRLGSRYIPNRLDVNSTVIMTKINELILALMDSKDSAQSGQSGSGFQQMMQQMMGMGQQQMGLNQMTQQLMQQMMQQGGQLGQSGMQQLSEIGEQQRQLQQQMDEMFNKYLTDQMGQQGLGGKAREISEEMKEINEMLRKGQLTPELIKRQKELLSKMLDFPKSMKTKKYSKKRESKVADNLYKRSFDDVNWDEIFKEDLIRKNLNQVAKDNYPKEYENLIRDYYDVLPQMMGKYYEEEGANDAQE